MKSFRKISETFPEAVELPHIIRLGTNLYVSSFFLMKLLPARFILDRARDEGKLKPGSTIIESTSGTFGLALALLSVSRRYRLTIVSDPAIDDSMKRRLEDLGTKVEIVTHPASIGGFQEARLARMAEIRAECPDHFWPSQYANPYNPGAYAPFAELITGSIGKIDCLVGTVGSGGSMCGTSMYLRSLFPEMISIGVDTHRSVLFGQLDGTRLLRGLGNSLMPKNLTHSIFDEVHWVDAAEAFLATRYLHQRHALFMGPTSGAAYFVAQWWASKHPTCSVLAILPDEGYRYVDTVYNDHWLLSNGLRLNHLPKDPRTVSHPSECTTDWTRMLWNKQSYEEVMGKPFSMNCGK